VSASVSRRQRRALERRGDAALARLAPTVVDDPEGSIALVREGELNILDTALAAFALVSMGLAGVVEEIASERARRPGTLPAVVIVGGWASVAFVRLQMMSPGGCA
jgi:hypothetical protein